jgi:hypothetical protein
VSHNPDRYDHARREDMAKLEVPRTSPIEQWSAAPYSGDDALVRSPEWQPRNTSAQTLPLRIRTN